MPHTTDPQASLRAAFAALGRGPAADAAMVAVAAMLRAALAQNDTEEQDPAGAFEELHDAMLALSDELASESTEPGDDGLGDLLAAAADL